MSGEGKKSVGAYRDTRARVIPENRPRRDFQQRRIARTRNSYARHRSAVPEGPDRKIGNNTRDRRADKTHRISPLPYHRAIAES